ncbi:MAG: hypothetical protein KatS3mg014_2511 [Actinomycetota bacterium]|nr:MAG: hypothetical protein KatS3mg014_2494 [Actinomycetota bacterium]GIV00896.1 MAG: hypothetical protein KatS3mg014_2511 [Actinomycetota bacterium]
MSRLARLLERLVEDLMWALAGQPGPRARRPVDDLDARFWRVVAEGWDAPYDWSLDR